MALIYDALFEISFLFFTKFHGLFLKTPGKKYNFKYMDNEIFSLDSTDFALLEHMQVDSSLSNQDLAARVHVSPATCLRRVKRLQEAGLIERQVALLNLDRMAAVLGHGLQAIIEITLDRQGQQAQEAFESRVASDEAVQQCYRVSPGPDFILVVHTADMPGYLDLARRLFTEDANVRNVKAFFSVRRAKFEPKIPLATAPR